MRDGSEAVDPRHDRCDAAYPGKGSRREAHQEGKSKMTGPGSRQPISAKVARSAAELVMRNQRDDPLKSIFSAAQLKLIDKWISATDPALDRAEAIRRLVGLGLKAKK
jgi:hypothetical protein